MVGPRRFELPTSCTPSKRASQAAPRPGGWTRLGGTGLGEPTSYKEGLPGGGLLDEAGLRDGNSASGVGKS